MHIQISIRHDTTNGHIKKFVEEELARLEEKYAPLSAEVVLDHEGAEGYLKTAEITMKVPGNVINVKESSDEIHKSIDLAVKVLEKQLHKYKDKHLKPTAMKRRDGQEREVIEE